MYLIDTPAYPPPNYMIRPPSSGSNFNNGGPSRPLAPGQAHQPEWSARFQHPPGFYGGPAFPPGPMMYNGHEPPPSNFRGYAPPEWSARFQPPPGFQGRPPVPPPGFHGGPMFNGYGTPSPFGNEPRLPQWSNQPPLPSNSPPRNPPPPKSQPPLPPLCKEHRPRPNKGRGAALCM